MEKSTVIGIGAGLCLTYGAIFLGEGWAMFFDLPSAVLVFGGSAAALLVNFSFDELRRVPAGLKEFLTFKTPALAEFLGTFSEFSRVARREGLLALDRRLDDDTDEFIRFGLEMAIDGIEEGEIDELMKMQIAEEARKRQFVGKFFSAFAMYAPAFGMIGTLIGLIQMMQSLDDPSQIGKGMAVALITTFYGALLANLICLPIAAKAKTQASEVLKARQMVHTGVLAIVRGESPSMIEKRLQSYLDEKAPSSRTGDDGGQLSKAA